MQTTDITPKGKIRVMTARGVVARELRELPVGDTLIVPFKYYTANNIRVAVTKLRSEGLDFAYDNSGDAHSVITRTK